jgi:CDP-paratose 2-epimerase
VVVFRAKSYCVKILITGICGFAGSTLARSFKEESSDCEIFGIDNLMRPGSWLNRESLTRIGIRIFHGDLRLASDLDTLPKVDWVVDAAANPSVLAGIDGKTSSRQLVEHNLIGTINLLEYCKRNKAGFVLLSTSRVYSITALSSLKVIVQDNAYQPEHSQVFPNGISERGVDETCSTLPPVSLYGSTKVASEHLALEYGATFDFPVWVNRCGVLAGPGQFGHPAQGIFAYWVHSFFEKKPLKYIGFGGQGYQVRDCLHPKDLINLLMKQFAEPLISSKPRVINVSGGVKNSMSLCQLTKWCEGYFGKREIESSDLNRQFDIPWMVLNNEAVFDHWGWHPATKIVDVLRAIARFAEENKNWCDISNS